MSRLGIIAGGGSLPEKLVKACRRDGRDVFVLALRGQADEAFLNGIPHAWTRLGATNEAISILKDNKVDTLVMAGGVRRPSLVELRPDWRTVQLFARLGKAAFGDDALLRAVTSELENEGFRIVGAHEIDNSLLSPAGIMGRHAPSPEHRKDMEKGIRTAKVLGQEDVGQAVVVQQGIVLGVEAVEGTDALLDRCRGLRRQGEGGVLVKACKPQQDRRLDLPAVGVRTVRKAHEAGLAGIAVEAGASLMLEREEAVATADSLGLFLFGFGGAGC